MYAEGMIPSLDAGSRLDALAAELRTEVEAALARLETDALAAFRAGDRDRILALVDERARFGDLAATLARWRGAAPAQVPVSRLVAAPSAAGEPTPPSERIVAPPPAPAPEERFAAREAPTAPEETVFTPSVSAPTPPAIIAQEAIRTQSQPNGSAARPTPRPKAARPERPAPPVPEGPLEGRSLVATRTRFFEEARALLARPGSGPIRAARLKSAICLGRALAGTLPDADALRLVNEEVRALRERWNAEISHDFFGLNPGRHIEPEGWHRLARAFALTAEAEEALPAILDEAATGPNRDAAADAAAAAVGLAFGTMGYYAEGVGDAEATRLRSALEGIGRLPRVREIVEAIKRKPAEWPRYEAMATGLPAQAKRLRTEGEKRAKGEAALAAFEALLKDGEADESFVDRLVNAARDALAAGVRPNAPRLRDPMMPYLEVLKEPDYAGDPALKGLTLEIAKYAAALLARRAVPAEPDLHANDPEHEVRLAAVREYLKGKVLGFAGSRRGVDRKVEEFKRTLGAREILWPDIEKHQAVGSLVEALKSADVVCLLVRFCRHSYKDALDEAKKGGGRMVFLPRGLGLNTVVYELYTQLRLEPVRSEPAFVS